MRRGRRVLGKEERESEKEGREREEGGGMQMMRVEVEEEVVMRKKGRGRGKGVMDEKGKERKGGSEGNECKAKRVSKRGEARQW